MATTMNRPSRRTTTGLTLLAVGVLALLIASAALVVNSSDPATSLTTSAAAGGGASLCYGEVIAPLENADALAVINQSTNQIVTTIGVQPLPNSPVFSGDGRLLFVPSYNDQTISIIDTATNTTQRTLSIAGSPARSIANGDGSILWVVYYDGTSYQLIRMNTTTGSALAQATLPDYPYQLFLSPDLSTLWLTISVVGYQSAFEFNATTLTLTSSTSTGLGGWNGAMSPDGSVIYFADYSSNGIGVFSTTTRMMTTLGTLPNPREVAVSPDGSTIYALSGTAWNNIAIYSVNVATGQATAGLTLAPLGNNANPAFLQLSADGLKLYISFVNYANGGVGVIETSNLTTGVFLPMEIYQAVTVCPLATDPAPPTTTTTTAADPVVPSFTA